MEDYKDLPGSSKSAPALAEIYNQFSKMVFNVALSYCPTTEDAEEITQDVFVEVYRSMGSFKGEASVKTWIYRIAVNKSLDFLRYKNRKKRFAFISSLTRDESGRASIDPPDFNHPGIKLENKEKAQQLNRALQQLPENQRTAFVLLKIEGLSQQETAEVMQTGVKAVESLYQRAKANLKKSLSDYYDESR
jgi:RNA polymerase sigma factor (sigma-70 family)